MGNDLLMLVGLNTNVCLNNSNVFLILKNFVFNN